MKENSENHRSKQTKQTKHCWEVKSSQVKFILLNNLHEEIDYKYIYNYQGYVFFLN